MKKMKTGFTLAEVLITLGIIGVIAAIVMPSVMTSYTYKTVGVKLAKFESQLEGSTRPFVVQNESFSTEDDCANINTYLEESYLLKKPLEDYDEQEVEKTVDGKKVKTKIRTLVDLGSDLPSDRKSEAKGFNDNFDISAKAQLLEIKDGTSFLVYKLDDYEEQEAIDTYKTGEVVFGVTFAPNVKGMPKTAQTTFDFVVTELGYVYPNTVNDKCMDSIWNADFNTNASMFKEGTACAKKASD